MKLERASIPNDPLIAPNIFAQTFVSEESRHGVKENLPEERLPLLDDAVQFTLVGDRLSQPKILLLR